MIHFDGFRKALESFPLDRVAAITGVDPTKIQQAAQTVAKNRMVIGNHDAHGLSSSIIHRQLPDS